MNLKDGDIELNQYIEYLKENYPIAIVKFGSSVVKEDYVSGISDTNLMIISKMYWMPKRDNAQYDIFICSPESISFGLENSDPVLVNAMYRGKILYDPFDFVENEKKIHGEKPLKASNLTTYRVLEDIGNHLSSAINRYFLNDDSEHNKIRMLRNIHAVAKNMGRLYAITEHGRVTGGYNDTLAWTDLGPEDLSKIIRTTRDYLVNHQRVSRKKSSKTLIGDDDLGVLLKFTEELYFDNLYIQGRSTSNELIDSFQKENFFLDKTIIGRINNSNNTHFLVGESSGKKYLFGRIYNEADIGDTINTAQEVSNETYPELFNTLRILM